MTTAAKIQRSLKAWIETKVRIDRWDLDPPSNAPVIVDGQRYAPVVGAIHPAEQFSLEQRSPNRFVANAVFPVEISYRFSGSSEYHQLPVGLMGAIAEHLVVSFLRDSSCVDGDITNARLGSSERLITVSRIEGEDSDWILTLRLEFAITWRSTPTDADLIGIQPPNDEEIELAGLKFGINVSNIPVTQKPGSFTKDSDLEVPV